jgi:hypothetical protein
MLYIFASESINPKNDKQDEYAQKENHKPKSG